MEIQGEDVLYLSEIQNEASGMQERRKGCGEARTEGKTARAHVSIKELTLCQYLHVQMSFSLSGKWCFWKKWLMQEENHWCVQKFLFCQRAKSTQGLVEIATKVGGLTRRILLTECGTNIFSHLRKGTNKE